LQKFKIEFDFWGNLLNSAMPIYLPAGKYYYADFYALMSCVSFDDSEKLHQLMAFQDHFNDGFRHPGYQLYDQYDQFVYQPFSDGLEILSMEYSGYTIWYWRTRRRRNSLWSCTGDDDGQLVNLISESGIICLIPKVLGDSIVKNARYDRTVELIAFDLDFDVAANINPTNGDISFHIDVI